MYEQHFGLSGHPFAATPDPDFYFDSAGHHRALAYLRHAVREGECFIVMTGDIGAGKTTLLHTLLRGLDPEAIVPALLAGTRLDARALLVAVLSGLHGDATGTSLDALRAHLRAVLAGLTSTGRRALIVVDEAQHLLPDAIAELTALAQLQSSHGAALQVLLCGEPALRRTLQGTPAAALRQPVFLFCDVGLLDPMETRAYIEHRLRHVGWVGSPAFADDAHDPIHAATGGVPRRINRLCDRLLMAAYQLELDTVSAELVARTNAELHEEIGGLGAAPVAAEAPRFAPAPPGSGTGGGSGNGSGGELGVAPAPGIIPALFSVAADAAPMTNPPAASPLPVPTSPAAQEPATPAQAAASARAPQAESSRPAAPAPGLIEDTEPKPVVAASTTREPAPDSVRVHHGAGARWAAASVVLVAALSTAWWAYRREPTPPAGAAAPRAAAGSVTNQRERDSAAERARSRELADIAPGTVGAPSAGPSMPAAASATPPAAATPQPELPTAQTEERRIEPAPAARPARRAAPRAHRADTEAAATGSRSRAEDGAAPHPAPAPGPCTAAVAALGLCNPTKNP